MNNATATQYPTRRSLREADKARAAAERAARMNSTQPFVSARQSEKMWHAEMGR